MMNCPFCDQEIPEDSDFCSCCGKSLEMVCSVCHQMVSEFAFLDYKVCPECSNPPYDQHSPEEDGYLGDCDHLDDGTPNYQDEEDDDQCGEEDEYPDEPHEVNLGDSPGGFKIYE